MHICGVMSYFLAKWLCDNYNINTRIRGVKKMKKKLMALLCAIALLLTLMPAETAEASADVPTLSDTELLVQERQSKTLTVAANGADIKKVTWKTSNPQKATVKSSGKLSATVTGVKKGVLRVAANVTYIQEGKTVTRKIVCRVVVTWGKEAAVFKFNKDKTMVTGITNRDSVTYAVIPDGVTSIGAGVFKECYKLTKVTIPDSVTSIGSYAFYSCFRLKYIRLPDALTSIGDRAFGECRFDVVCIPDGVTRIGAGAFEFCSELTTINIPDGITRIEDRTFRSCWNLKSIRIPDSVTSIGKEAFDNCDSITEIDIPNGVTSIEDCAFSWTHLTQIDIPDSVTRIGPEAFSDCRDLTKVTIPDSVTRIGVGAFHGCDNLAYVTWGGKICDRNDREYAYLWQRL